MLTLFFTLILSTTSIAADHFSATAERQNQTPYAYAITSESLDFHAELESGAEKERFELINLIKQDQALHQGILDFATLGHVEQEQILVKVFSLQTGAYPVAPKLILSKGPKGQDAFFEFDLIHQGPGTVYIDFKSLGATDHPYASLLLLIHETRHSAQLQLAFSTNGVLARGYAEAFGAQKKVFDYQEKISYCDFMSLLNEYEAFQYANFILNRLTEGKVNISGMGTLASQYDQFGKVLLDLPALMHNNPKDEWFLLFNDLAKAQ